MHLFSIIFGSLLGGLLLIALALWVCFWAASDNKYGEIRVVRVVIAALVIIAEISLFVTLFFKFLEYIFEGK